MIIGVDMDEILSQTLESVLAAHQIKTGKHIKIEQITDYYWRQIAGLNTSFEEVLSVMDSLLLENHDDIMPVIWAYEALYQLKQAWHSLVVITARPKIFYDSTTSWIAKHFAGVFDEVHYAWYHSDDAIPKRQICHNLWVEIMIEDNYHYALDLIDHNIPTILLNRPRNIWHEDPETGLYRVSHWDKVPLMIK
jgi:uncharacterized HAD superfamily protein